MVSRSLCAAPSRLRRDYQRKQTEWSCAATRVSISRGRRRKRARCRRKKRTQYVLLSYPAVLAQLQLCCGPCFLLVFCICLCLPACVLLSYGNTMFSTMLTQRAHRRKKSASTSSSSTNCEKTYCELRTNVKRCGWTMSS